MSLVPPRIFDYDKLRDSAEGKFLKIVIQLDKKKIFQG